MEAYNYDEIRPYNDSEIKEVIARNIKDEEFLQVVKFLYQDKMDAVLKLLPTLSTIRDFQMEIISNLILSNHEKTGDGIEISGLENISHDKKCLFISNHRDIVLDAGFLNSLLLKNGYDTAQDAIGDNLCAKPWITDMLKLNKSFIVKRSGTKRDIFEASKRLSAYIRSRIKENLDSIWIAEREGRAKDSNDTAQESVLKMFSMSAEGNMKESFKELQITPVSISYEYDSCDYLKAKEFQQKRDNADFKKSAADDVRSMGEGITGYRGHVHYEITKCINDELDEVLDDNADRATAIEAVKQLIDKHIHKGYTIYTHNYVALEERVGKTIFENKYTAADKKKFDEYIDSRIEKIDLENKDYEFLRAKLLEMYSNPLLNQLRVYGMKDELLGL